MVTVLMAVMIVGMVVIVGLFITRLSGPQSFGVPPEITLPDGTVPTAYTVGPNWYGVVTEDNRILIFDAASGTLQQEIEITVPQ